MSTEKQEVKPAKRRSWKKMAAYGGGGVVVLVVLAYFVVSSSAFLKAVVLPNLSSALNAEVEAEQISLSPFSSVTIKNLKVQTTGVQPVLAAEQTLVRYNLWSILGGKIEVGEIQLDSPALLIVQQPDGTTNLDPLLQGKPGEEDKPSEPSGSSEPLQINVQSVRLNNASFKWVVLQADGGREEKALNNLDLAVNNLQNGQSATLELNAELVLDSRQPASQTNGLMTAQLGGKFTLNLTDDLAPGALQGSLKLAVKKAEGWMSELASVQADLNADVTATEIRQFLLGFKRQGASLGEFSVSGPFDLQTMEGTIGLELRSLNRQVLNLALGGSGLEFGPQTTVNSTNQLQIAQAGQKLGVTGGLRVGSATVLLQDVKTPVLDMALDYDMELDQSSQGGILTLSALGLSGSQNQTPFLSGGLTSPMTIALSETAPSSMDSRLALVLTNLNLADWRPFLKGFDPSGLVQMNLVLDASDSGQQMKVDLQTRIQELSLKLDTNVVRLASLEVSLEGDLAQFEKLELRQFRTLLMQSQGTVAEASVTGRYDLGSGASDLAMQAQAGLPGLLEVMPQPDTRFSSGTMSLHGTLTGDGSQNRFAGQLGLRSLTGQFGEYAFDDYATELDLALTLAGQVLDIQKWETVITQKGQAGGAVRLDGRFDMAQNRGTMNLALDGLNQHSLRPFLQPMLSGQTLVSASLSGTNQAQFDLAGPSRIDAFVQLKNLVVEGPGQRFKDTPLEVTLLAKASMANQKLDLADTRVRLTPTDRAGNELQLTGWLDFSDTNALQGDLKLASSGLDLDTYYDLFVGSGATTNQAKETAPPAAEPSAPPAEPEPMALPVNNFNLAGNIDQLYLKEMEIKDLQLLVSISGDTIRVQPLKMLLNGRDFEARTDLNLGVAGWEYDLGLDMDHVPLVPLVNTFRPDLKGKIKGELLVNTRLKGAGITDPSLKKNLAGQFSLSVTNADIEVLPPTIRLIVFPVMTLLRLNEMTGSPLHLVDLRASVQQGLIDLSQAQVRSDAFDVTLLGQIPMADWLTNSPLTKVPVQFSLSRNVAKKSNLVPANAPEDTPYVVLPEFVKLGGTIGKPTVKLDKLKIAGLVAKSTAGLGVLAGEKTGETLKDVGGLLTGEAPTGALKDLGGLLKGLGGAKTNESSIVITNQPGQVTTNAPPSVNPLDFLNRLRK